MIYHNATYLTITASVDEVEPEPSETVEDGQFCSGVCVAVVLVLGVLSAVLNLVLFIVILTKRRAALRQNTDPGNLTASPPEQVQDSKSLTYSALSFNAKKKKRRSNFQTDNPPVIYAATR
ncbi:uncharacterized protein LOC116224665 isoform X2 [Clupea harengus]|nr:uncharacterized protein LOC116224665 isoform X2 [Clupea harengus]